MRTRADQRRAITRNPNAAAFALLQGAQLVEMLPAGGDRVRFVVEFPEVRGGNLADDYARSSYARFMAIKDQLLDEARARKGRR